MEKEAQAPSFERTLKELEKIVNELEKGETPLEAQLKSFEKGIALSRECLTRLEEVEKRVELLTRNPQSSLGTTPFSEKP
ncbi:MAG: exodeoxyribonuclease VII small subunit [Deltaproteobacteria bacterium]|nr:exodeoxyribonuclease VII small subunit [Deltaproteobacteria bacterium]